MARSMPKQRPGDSKQDYQTPPEFLEAVARRFGRITWDLAALPETAAARGFFSPHHLNATLVDWTEHLGPRDVAWLNPPFGKIGSIWLPLVSKWLPRIPGLKVLALLPASVGSEWFAEHCNGRAMNLGLSPRMTFVGEKDPYPKDLMLSCFGYGVHGFDCWRWQPATRRRKTKTAEQAA